MTPTSTLSQPATPACVPATEPALVPWMRYLLYFVGGYNILAGVTMAVFYHECFAVFDLPKPEIMLPMQLVGVMVGLYGAGYLLTAWNPIENRNVLTLGFFSKLLGSILGVMYVVNGKLPVAFLPILFFADIIYLPPFLAIMRRLYRLARVNGNLAAPNERAANSCAA